MAVLKLQLLTLQQNIRAKRKFNFQVGANRIKTEVVVTCYGNGKGQGNELLFSQQFQNITYSAITVFPADV